MSELQNSASSNASKGKAEAESRLSSACTARSTAFMDIILNSIRKLKHSFASHARLFGHRTRGSEVESSDLYLPKAQSPPSNPNGNSSARESFDDVPLTGLTAAQIHWYFGRLYELKTGSNRSVSRISAPAIGRQGICLRRSGTKH